MRNRGLYKQEIDIKFRSKTMCVIYPFHVSCSKINRLHFKGSNGATLPLYSLALQATLTRGYHIYGWSNKMKLDTLIQIKTAENHMSVSKSQAHQRTSHTKAV